jgi:two-component system OmpR family response regulator
VHPEPLTGLKIVVVEDHPPLLKQIGSFLEQFGANVALAENGVQGLKAIKNNRPHVVVTDIVMDAVDGFELLRQIREFGRNEGGNVSVIAMTGLIKEADRINKAGFQACLFKPFSPDELVADIRLLDPRKNSAPDIQTKKKRNKGKSRQGKVI